MSDGWSLAQVLNLQTGFLAALVILSSGVVAVYLYRPSYKHQLERMLELYTELNGTIEGLRAATTGGRGDVTHAMTEVLTTLKQVERNTEKKRVSVAAPKAEPVIVPNRVPEKDLSRISDYVEKTDVTPARKRPASKPLRRTV